MAGSAVPIPRTCLRFSRTSPVVVTGNSEGTVEVFRLMGNYPTYY
jgi:hypothetical protein